MLHAGDALKADLGALDPPPTALVANLAYNIAIPLIMTTIAGLPSVRRWAVMVQQELGERLFASPSTKAYAAVSVLTQLACRLREGAAGARLAPSGRGRAWSRASSRFVRRRGRRRGRGRRSPAASTRPCSHLVRLAFGQRRKMLVQLARRRGARRRHAQPRRRARGAARARR